jgi:hypothetical protein
MRSALLFAARVAVVVAPLVCAACGARSSLYDAPAGATGGSGGGGGSGEGGGGAGSACEPGAVTAMVTSKLGAYGVAVDEASLYWASRAGSVETKPLLGGEPSVIATGQSPRDVVVDQDTIYWVDQDQGTVLARNKAGGPTLVIAESQPRPGAIAQDEQHVYWANAGSDIAGSIVRAGKDGSSVTVLAEVEQALGVAVDGDAVYFTSYGTAQGVFRIDKQSGEIKALVPAPILDSADLVGVAVRNGIVYFTLSRFLDSIGQVWSVPAAGGTPVLLVDQLGSPSEVAADDTHVYWLASGYSEITGTLGRAPIGGGPPEVLATTPHFGHIGLALDAHAAYFTRLWASSASPPDGASVLRWCKTP